MIRYWYTLTVDYQAKRWEGDDTGWGLRYLKLLLSRKLSYAGTVVSLLLCDEQRPATVGNLVNEFDKPPLARLAQLALDDRFDEHDPLREVVRVAERFAAFLAEEDNRRKATAVRSATELRNDAELGEVRRLADDLHDALGRVLFDSFLGDRARRYLVM